MLNTDITEYTKEDEKIVSSFFPKSNLCQLIFDDKMKMHDKIKNKLLEIADSYVDFMGIDFFIHDIVLTGSLANYNWSEYSDVDIHIIVDFENQKYSSEIMKEFFDAKEKAWKSKHNIKIKNFDVELYVQDTNEEAVSSGIYSLLKNKWVIEPERKKVNINDKKILKKADLYAAKINKLISQSKNNDINHELNILWNKLKKFRKCGLGKNGEYSYENLTFKLLRRNGYVEKLLNIKSKSLDKKLSFT